MTREHFYRPPSDRRSRVQSVLLVVGLWWVASCASLSPPLTGLAAQPPFNDQKSATEKTLQQLQKSEAELQAELDRVQRHLYAYRIHLADAARKDGKLALARKHLAACSERLRHWEWHYLSRQCAAPKQPAALVIKGLGKQINDLAFSPDSKRLAIASSDKSLVLHDAHSGELVASIACPATHRIAFAEGGAALLACAWTRPVTCWDSHTGKEMYALPEPQAQTLEFAVSRDGKRLASSDGKTISVWDLAARKVVKTLKGAKHDVGRMSFSADGRWLACASGLPLLTDPGELTLWDLEKGKAVPLPKKHTKKISALAFSPDGKLLATSSYDGAALVWDVASRKDIHALSGHGGSVLDLAFSPDGQRLVTAGLDRTVCLWDVPSGVEVFRLEGADSVHVVAFSPDGRRLAGAARGKTVTIWSTAPPPKL